MMSFYHIIMSFGSIIHNFPYIANGYKILNRCRDDIILQTVHSSQRNNKSQPTSIRPQGRPVGQPCTRFMHTILPESSCPWFCCCCVNSNDYSFPEIPLVCHYTYVAIHSRKVKVVRDLALCSYMHTCMHVLAKVKGLNILAISNCSVSKGYPPLLPPTFRVDFPWTWGS